MQLKSFLIATVVFLSLDAIWLGYLGRQLYVDGLAEFMRGETNYYAAALSYALIILGICVFVIPKAAGSTLAALGWGAVFGLVCYGVFDFTNLAVITNWPLWISILDIAWGCVVCGFSSFATVWLSKII